MPRLHLTAETKSYGCENGFPNFKSQISYLQL